MDTIPELQYVIELEVACCSDDVHQVSMAAAQRLDFLKHSQASWKTSRLKPSRPMPITTTDDMYAFDANIFDGSVFVYKCFQTKDLGNASLWDAMELISVEAESIVSNRRCWHFDSPFEIHSIYKSRNLLVLLQWTSRNNYSQDQWVFV